MKWIVLLLVLLIPANGHGESYMFPGPWQDVDQGSLPLCWAASASNALAATGWETEAYPDAQAIFQKFVKEWPIWAGGFMNYGWNWYIAENFPDLNPYDYYQFPLEMSGVGPSLEQFLRDGMAVSIVLMPDAGQGHALSVWGGDFTEGQMILHVTNSNDRVEALLQYPFFLNGEGRWQYDGTKYQGWDIVAVQGLMSRPVLPRRMVPVETTPIPEPSTLVLIGIGLMMAGCAIGRRKWKWFKDGGKNSCFPGRNAS